MDESGDGFLDRMKDERSAGLFLYSIGFSSIIIAGKGAPVTCGVLNADDALSRGLADAPQNTLTLFADTEGRTVYMGRKDAVEKIVADSTPIELRSVEVILDEVILDDNERQIPNRRYTLLSLTEHGGRFAFNMCPTDLSEKPAPAMVEFLRKRRPRSAF